MKLFVLDRDMLLNALQFHYFEQNVFVEKQSFIKMVKIIQPIVKTNDNWFKGSVEIKKGWGNQNQRMKERNWLIIGKKYIFL